jgi:membrane protein
MLCSVAAANETAEITSSSTGLIMKLFRHTPCPPLRAYRKLQSPTMPLSTAARALPQRLVGAFNTWNAHDGPQLGASIAFYSIFALAPMLVIATAIAGLAFGADAVRGRVVEELGGLLGTTAAKAIEAMIAAAWRPGQGVVAGALGVVMLLVAATGVLVEMKRALNAILEVRTTQGPVLTTIVRARLTALALVLGFGFLTIVSLLLSAAVSAAASYLPERYPQLKYLLSTLDLAASIAVLSLAFAALIKWLPDRPPSPRVVAIAALSASVLFVLGKTLVGLYLARAAVVSTYGAAGSLVVLIIWVYYTSQVLLLGAAFGRQFEATRTSFGTQTQRPGAAGVESERAGST